MSLHLPFNPRKILVIDNSLAPRIEQLASFVQKKWPKAKVLLVVKKAAKIKDTRKQRFHLYARKSPGSVSEGFKLALRLRATRPDVILIRKHDLSIKFLLFLIINGNSLIYLWRINDKNEFSFIPIKRRELLCEPFGKKKFYQSIFLSIVPFLLMIFCVPLLIISRVPHQTKKKVLKTIRDNLSLGPSADNPALWMWLQFFMLIDNLFLKNTNYVRVPSKILIIRLDHIGDNVNTVPLIRRLRDIYPKADITIMCDSGLFLWQNCPYVNKVIEYKSNNYLFNRGRKKVKYCLRPMSWYFKIRKEGFDLVLDPVGRTETHIISYFSSNAKRLSNTYYPYKLANIDVVTNHYETNLHETERALSLITKPEDLGGEDKDLEIWQGKDKKHWSKEYLSLLGLSESRQFIGIHPGAMSHLRFWPIERYAEVALRVADKYGFDILFFEPPDKPEMTNYFINYIPKIQEITKVIRNVDLLLLADLISKCRIFICSDSGPMHLAAATKTPMVAIFGPGEYWRWQPLHAKSIVVRKPIDCSPCSQNNCTDPQCILGVQISDVLQAAELVLAKCSVNCPLS